MGILFSRQCEYALQAVSYLALLPGGEVVSIKALAETLNVPFHYLGKILQVLVQNGILVSHRGHNGGFALASSPEETTYRDIIETIDGTQFNHQCAMGFAECSNERPCAIHEQWNKSREELYRLFSGRNVAEMAKAMKKPGYTSRRHPNQLKRKFIHEELHAVNGRSGHRPASRE